MTALHKFLPCDHEAQFHVERFDAFSTFIDALNTPIPLDVLAVMRMEDHLRGTAFGFRFLPQSLCQRRSKAIAVPAATGDGA